MYILEEMQCNISVNILSMVHCESKVESMRIFPKTSAKNKFLIILKMFISRATKTKMGYGGNIKGHCVVTLQSET